jgi:hypothetical protein
MIDVIFTIRLGIKDNLENKKHISQFSKFLDRKYGEHANKFLHDLLLDAQLPFEGDMTTNPDHNLQEDVFSEYRHPQQVEEHKWTLDDLPIQNNLPIWVRLENQWIKARTQIKGQASSIIIEPENVKIPLSEALFLKW